MNFVFAFHLTDDFKHRNHIQILYHIACILLECCVLRMGCKAVGPVCCVMHVKEPRTLIVKEKGLAPLFLDSRREHPAGWICARYKSYHYYSVMNGVQINNSGKK